MEEAVKEAVELGRGVISRTIKTIKYNAPRKLHVS